MSVIQMPRPKDSFRCMLCQKWTEHRHGAMIDLTFEIAEKHELNFLEADNCSIGVCPNCEYESTDQLPA